MPSVLGDILILGDVVFDNVQFPFATPSQITVPGEHMLGVQKLIGGDRVIDAMGPDPGVIAWSGRWRGPNAVSGDQAMAAMRDAGAQIPCTWNAYFFMVVIKSYKSTYESFREIPYSVELIVLPISAGPGGPSSLDDSVDGDMGAAQGAGGFQ